MMSRNASPSDALASGALNNLRRINLGPNAKFAESGDFLVHRFQQACRLYGVKLISAAGDGFTAKIAVTKNGSSILKDEGIVNAAGALTAGEVKSLNFLDANTDGYVDFAAGDLLKVVLSDVANAVADTDYAALDLDLVQG